MNKRLGEINWGAVVFYAIPVALVTCAIVAGVKAVCDKYSN